jgi:hypothetical protein
MKIGKLWLLRPLAFGIVRHLLYCCNVNAPIKVVRNMYEDNND